MSYIIIDSPLANKKFRVLFPNGGHVDIGDIFYEDYTKHHDIRRVYNYVSRHFKREDWTINGIHTAGWWAYHLLWSKPSLREAIKNIEQKFNIKVNYVDYSDLFSNI